jgi:hypothetical protein
MTLEEAVARHWFFFTPNRMWCAAKVLPSGTNINLSTGNVMMAAAMRRLLPIISILEFGWDQEKENFRKSGG